MPKTSSIRSAVSIELRLVTDRQTDRHGAMASTSASIASRGEKCGTVTSCTVYTTLQHARCSRRCCLLTCFCRLLKPDDELEGCFSTDCSLVEKCPCRQGSIGRHGFRATLYSYVLKDRNVRKLTLLPARGLHV